MDKYTGPERRKSPRIYRPFVVSYKIANKRDTVAKIVQLRNISEGGFAFRILDEFKVGEILDLYIRLPLAKEAIRAKGKVVEACKLNLEDLFCETRVIFSEISEEAKNKIKEAVKAAIEGNKI